MLGSGVGGRIEGGHVRNGCGGYDRENFDIRKVDGVYRRDGRLAIGRGVQGRRR